MVSITAKVFRNTLVIFLGQVGYMFLGFIWSIKLGRYLGPHDFGLYNSLYSYIAFFELLTNSGIDTVTVRQISAEPETKDQWVGHAFLLKLILGAVAWLLCLSCIGLIPTDKIPIQPYLMVASFTIFLSCFSFFTSVFQAQLKMLVPVLAKLAGATLFIVAAFYLAARQHPLQAFVAAKLLVLGLGPLLIGLAGLSMLDHYGPIKAVYLKRILVESFPFFVSSIFILIYYRIGVLMIGWFKSQEQVGFYSAAFQLTASLAVIPSALMTSLYPVFSKEAGEVTDRLRKAFRYSLKYLFLLILPIAVGTTLLATEIIQFFFKQAYLPAGQALAILVWAQVFNFIGYVLGYLLWALKKQNINAWTNVGMVVINIGLNLVLIPGLGFNGASLATVATEAFSVAVWSCFIFKIFKGFPQGWLVKPLFAAGVMAGALWGLNQSPWMGMWPAYASLGFRVIAGAAVYLVALLLLKVLGDEDWILFKSALWKR